MYDRDELNNIVHHSNGLNLELVNECPGFFKVSSRPAPNRLTCFPLSV